MPSIASRTALPKGVRLNTLLWKSNTANGGAPATLVMVIIYRPGLVWS